MAATTAVGGERRGPAGLSRRELEVLQLIAQGQTNAQAAERLGISALTVKKHLERMYAATGTGNRTELIALAFQRQARSGEGRETARPRHNLPAALTSFVGREREVAEVAALIASARLVTLGGPGGVGKTRLALEVARGVLDRFPDGVWLVELASLADPRLVVQTVSAALGVREPVRSGVPTLAAELRGKTLLLVLDNCEHLARACADLVAALLAASPGLRVLATSRETLGTSGEVFWTVPTLSVPPTAERSAGALLEAARDSEAVRLFAERASQRAPRFAVTSENVRAVAQICRRLDGLPLALELAAARMNVLSVGEIAARLDDRFRELRTDAPATVPRHRTLRGAIDWSHQLLGRAEARLFERLAVFAGGCTLDAATAVCGGDEIDAAEVLELLARLVDRSFVIADTRSTPTRYRMLETLQQYARERFDRSSGAEAVRGRHAAYFAGLAEAAESQLSGSDQLAWYARLDSDHDNLRAALRWSLERDGTTALRLAGALWRFWDVRMFKDEGRRWLEAALASEHEAPAPVLIKALNGAGNMAQSTGDYERSVELHERSLAIAREVGDPRSVARSLSNLGDQALNMRRHADARRLHEEALRSFEALADTWGIAISHIELGQVAYDLDDLDSAASRYDRGLALIRESEDQHRVAHALLHIGKVARARADLDAAVRLIGEALRTFVAFADAWMTTIAVGQLASVAVARGRAVEGARLYGAVVTAQRALAMCQAPHWTRDIERGMAAARSALGDGPFAAAWAAGEAMTLDDAVASALRITDETMSDSPAVQLSV